MHIVINGKLIGLNEYINATRRNKYMGASLKKKQEQFISLFIRDKKTFVNPVHITFNWYESSKKRDIDNISFAKKFILDALVNCGILINDSQKYVQHCSDNVFLDKNNPRIEIIIKEVKNGI